MAKKKPTLSASPAKSTASTESKTTKASTATGNQRPFTDEQIGIVAGEIWHLLSTDGGQPLTAVKKTIAAPADLVAAAVGWLAREGKLDFAKRGRAIHITLR
jgi:predicted double-glycine peptidase